MSLNINGKLTENVLFYLYAYYLKHGSWSESTRNKPYSVGNKPFTSINVNIKVSLKSVSGHKRIHGN